MMRIALVGAGAMGTIMAEEIYPRLRDDVEVAIVVDRHQERGRPLAERLGAAYLPSLQEAISMGGIDGVDIRLQHSAHRAAVVQAADAGLHVLVEKPVVTTVDDAIAIQDAQRRSGVVMAVAENYPHLAATRATREAMDGGAIGDVLAVRTTRAYTLDGVWANTTWRQGTGPDAGLLWDQGTHHTSLIRALAGDVLTVSATRAMNDVLGSEVVTVDLQLTSGLIAQSLYCWGTPAVPLEAEAVVLGSTGRIEIRVDYDAEDGGATLIGGPRSRTLADRDGYYDSHATIVADWVDAVRTESAPRVGLASAVEDVRVVLAAQRSIAEEGRRVPLAEVSVE